MTATASSHTFQITHTETPRNRKRNTTGMRIDFLAPCPTCGFNASKDTNPPGVDPEADGSRRQKRSTAAAKHYRRTGK